VLATLASTRTGALQAAGDPLDVALNGGYHLAFAIGAVLIAVAIVVGIVVLESEPKAAKDAAPELARPQAACPEAT
jgi:hypothetical protein